MNPSDPSGPAPFSWGKLRAALNSGREKRPEILSLAGAFLTCAAAFLLLGEADLARLGRADIGLEVGRV
ncbi:MAG TPA: hypothetical protein P5117_09265, partial [Spirochaetia bacterium]|nr:hypothetical protein [Spirochaetia bacterium]